MYLFVDTETTGVNRTQDRVVQVAWILADEDGAVVHAKGHIIRPDGFYIPAGAVAIHGISTERAKREGAPLAVVLEELARDAKGIDCVVAHNATFDLAFLQREFSGARLKYPLDAIRSVCTMLSSVAYCRLPKASGGLGYKWPKLEELHFHLFREYFGSAHDAGADVQACMRCFFELVKRGVIAAPKARPTIAVQSPPPERRPGPASSTRLKGGQGEVPLAQSRVAPLKLAAELAVMRSQLEAEQARVAELQKRIDYLESKEGLFSQAKNSDDIEWRKAVAKDPRCPANILDELAEDEDELDVLLCLAGNPSSTARVFECLDGWYGIADDLWFTWPNDSVVFDRYVDILDMLPRALERNPSCPEKIRSYFDTYAERTEITLAACRAVQATGAVVSGSFSDDQMLDMLSEKLAELPMATAEAILGRYPLAKDAIDRVKRLAINKPTFFAFVIRSHGDVLIREWDQRSVSCKCVAGVSLGAAFALIIDMRGENPGEQVAVNLGAVVEVLLERHFEPLGFHRKNVIWLYRNSDANLDRVYFVDEEEYGWNPLGPWDFGMLNKLAKAWPMLNNNEVKKRVSAAVAAADDQPY